MLRCFEEFDMNLLLASLVPLTGVLVVSSSAEADKQIAANVTNANKVFEAVISLKWTEKSLIKDVQSNL